MSRLRCSSLSHPALAQVDPYLEVAEPFPTLPRLLIPSRRVPVKPPVMHYGWRVPRDFLLAYALAHKIKRKWGRALSEYERMSFALGAIDAECNAGTPSYHLGLQLTCIGNLQSDQMLIISIYTNYELRLDNLTPEDAIERLRKGLELTEPPAWFLDNEKWAWGWW